MTRNEMNLVNMFKTVDRFLTVNNELLKGYPPIIESHLRINQGLGIIDELSETQSTDTKVQTGLKKNEKTKLDQTMLKVSDAMNAVAAATNDEELKLIANWPKSLLNRLREDNYYIKAQQVYKAALPLASKLEVWGVSMEDIEALNTLSASFKNRTPDRRNVVVISKQASTDLHNTVVILKKEFKDTLDKLMKPFATIQPTLFGQYSNARIVVDIAATQKPKDNGEEVTNTDIQK